MMLLPAILITGLSTIIIKAFAKGEVEETEMVLGRVDLNNYFDEMELGQLNDEDVENEVQIFQNALDFSKTKAREIMIPRNEVVAMNIDDNVEDLRSILFPQVYLRY